MKKFLFFMLTLITLLVINCPEELFLVKIPEENRHLYFRLRNDMGQDLLVNILMKIVKIYHQEIHLVLKMRLVGQFKQ